MRRLLLLPPALALAAALAFRPAAADEAPSHWAAEWAETDFSRSSVPFAEILSGGVARDAIPAIDDPLFAPAASVAGLPGSEPVIAVSIAGDARAYPLRILMWHEIVNDTVGGTPVAVTFCPLCNSGVVYDRRVAGAVLDFGTTGKLRNSDLVMYDRQTGSWWQQFTGEGIVGAHTGAALAALPARLESFAHFKARAGAEALVLVPRDPAARRYGRNPYAKYDSAARPFLYRGALPEGIAPLARVVAVDGEAWSLALLRRLGRYERGDLIITWEPGQNSALDDATIARGRDVGNVVVRRKRAGGLEDAVHDVSFAFAFHAFHPDGTIHTDVEDLR